MTSAGALTFTSTAVIALATSLSVRPLLLRLKILDVPTHRSSHTAPVARGGGLAPVVTIALGILLFVATDEAPSERTFLVFMAVVVAAGLLGWFEDSRGVSAGKRAAAHLLIGGAGVGALAAGRPTAWWLITVAAVAVAAYINVANFMDGINGISGMHGLVVGTTLGALGRIEGVHWLAVIGGVLGLAFAGFLTVNLGGRVFLGDTGSYALGAACALGAIAAAMDGVPLLSVIAPLTIYLADTGVTLTRRVLRGDRWAEAHREHVYQKLVDGGWSHLRCAVVVSLFTATAGGLGVAHALGGLAPLWVVLPLGALSAAYLGLPRMSAWGSHRAFGVERTRS
ncbi:UDP-phosphate glycosyltransferase [Actinotalea ferrariae CF5-4]|uniref:UDP-phosphate glycosyltransferase n=1 Tax=Actinotalea ferrariae CF5-4 TaxID=948458 RepID=A0A021VVH8_9CELL|nr:hypothetical protein [Actinotalea ferrariae]EYR65123.1 UDP-phosphate glycosyltransferase [Actinotalea ferrariae CF5-4]